MTVETKRRTGYDNDKIEEVMDTVVKLEGLHDNSTMFPIFTLYSLLSEGEDFIRTFSMPILEVALIFAANQEYVKNNFNRERAISSLKSKLNRSLYMQTKYWTILELSNEPFYALMHKAVSSVGEDYVEILTILSVLFQVDVTDCVGAINAESIFSRTNTSKTLLTKSDLDLYNSN